MGLTTHRPYPTASASQGHHAIHLATAQELRTELTAFVCYDKRLLTRPARSGLPVESPS